VILLSLILFSVFSICVGVGVTALGNYPLYWGLLAGWLCPSVVLMLVMSSYILKDRSGMQTHRYRNNPPVPPGREHLRRRIAVPSPVYIVRSGTAYRLAATALSRPENCRNQAVSRRHK
jgi:hypothetical protein